MNVDFAALAQQLRLATQAAFQELITQHGAEGIYAFALYSDEGALTVCPAANTLAHLATRPTDDEAEYYKFEPAEWKYEMVGADEQFEALSRLLRTAVCTHDDDQAWFDAFRQQLYGTCVRVLAELHQERFFQQAAGQEVFLTFRVSDEDPDPAADARLVRQLNDHRYRDEYLAWQRTRAQE